MKIRCNFKNVMAHYVDEEKGICSCGAQVFYVESNGTDVWHCPIEDSLEEIQNNSASSSYLLSQRRLLWEMMYRSDEF